MGSDDLFGGPFAAGQAEGRGGPGMVGGAAGGEGASESADDPLLMDLAAERRGDSSLAVEAPSGRRVPFDHDRLVASVERARSAGAGTDRAGLGSEVADIARLTLLSLTESGGRVIQPEQLGELVERVLIELGAVETARAYIVFRDRRSRSRAAQREPGPEGAEDGAASGLPLVRGAAGPEPFRPRRIVGALVEEAGLLPDQAELVAERVLQTMRGSSLRSVGTGLVRELVSNELLALGFDDALRRHEAIGIPRHDLARTFEGSRAGCEPAQLALPWQASPHHAFGAEVSARVLQRWTLEDLLTAPHADAHAAGDLHVIGTGAPHRVIARSVPAGLLASDGAASPGVDAARALAARLGEVARETEQGLLVHGVEPHELALSEEGGASELLGGIAAASTGAGVPVDLVLTGAAETGAAEARLQVQARTRILAALSSMARQRVPGAPRVFVDHGALRQVLVSGGAHRAEHIADRVEALLAEGRLVPVWCDVAGARWAGPGLIERDGSSSTSSPSLSIDAAVALNLPRIARRIGPWREEEFLGRLHGLLELAMGALAERMAFVRRSRKAHGEALNDRPGAVLVPVGLYEALRILGDGLARAELGARVLGFLSDAAARGGSERDIEVRVSTAFGSEAAARFARCDAALGGSRQPRLFGDMPLPEEEYGSPYRVGAGSLAGSAPGKGRAAAHWEARAEALAGLARASSTGELLPTGPPGEHGPGSTSGSTPGASSGAGAGMGMRSGVARRPAPGDATSISGAESGDRLLITSLLVDRPRMAAWSRFETLRRFRKGRPEGPAETTLF